MKKILLLLVLILLPHGSFAETLSYNIFWEKTNIGKATVTLEENIMKIDVATTGLMNTILKYANSMESTFKVKKNVYVPEVYKEMMKRREKVKNIEIIYNNGKPTRKTIDPKENDPRPDINLKDLSGVSNPITAILNARSKIIDSIRDGSNTVTTTVFDGKRISNVTMDISVNQKMNNDYGTPLMIKVIMTIESGDGYTDKEIKSVEKNKPKLILYLNSETFIPERIDAKVSVGSAYMILNK